MDLKNFLIQLKCFLSHSSILGNSREQFKTKAKMLNCYIDQKWNHNNGYNEVNCNVKINRTISEYKNLGFSFDDDNLNQSIKLCERFIDFVSLSTKLVENTQVPRLTKNNIEITTLLKKILAAADEFQEIDTWRELGVDSFNSKINLEDGLVISDHCKSVFIPTIKQYAKDLLQDYNAMLAGERIFGIGEF